MLDKALALGFDAVATGHYATVVDGPAGVELHRAVDGAKDQSYVLGVLDEQQLRALALPARRHAEVEGPGGGSSAAGCSSPTSRTATTSASSPTATTRGWLREKLGDRAPNQGGEIVDEATGAVLGEHTGTYGFTIGQRKGLRLGHPAPDGRPRYVLDIEPVTGTVTVGPRERLAVERLTGDRLRWCGPPLPAGTVLDGDAVTVQLRAHGAEHRAVVRVGDGVLEVELIDHASGIAPGQAVVVYDGTRVVGSATITVAERVRG